MLEFWGKSRDLVVRKPLFEAIPEAKNQGYEELSANVFKTGNAFSATELPVTLPRRGALQTVYINFSFTPIVEVDGVISGIMAMAIDVTEQVLARLKIEEVVRQRTLELADANKALLGANEELKRSNKNLEEFAYAASHDLKEPLRKIKYLGQRIKISMNDRMTQEENLQIERIESASVRMGSLIDNLLSYSQVSIRPDGVKEVDLTQLLPQVIEDFDLVIEENKAVITAEEMCIVQGHPHQLEQVFHNLLGNALKYRKLDATLKVHISCRKLLGKEADLQMPENRQQQSFYRIEVRDNGIGFEQAHAERIFNVFTRLHGMSEYKGAGIGLSIVRKAVENHNGYIWAKSKPGEGSTFTVLLPAD